MDHHLGYYIGLLARPIGAGDMGQVYPIARGTAPLMTAPRRCLLGEILSLVGWAGIVALASGVFLLSLRGGRDLARRNRRAIGFALFTAVTICGYSLVDGIGARAAGNAHAYALRPCSWSTAPSDQLLSPGGPQAGASMPGMARHWQCGLVGGALSLTAYWIAIWAMTVAPIALVAALRETSVLFGAAIAVIFLKEPLTRAPPHRRPLILIGLVCMRVF